MEGTPKDLSSNDELRTTCEDDSITAPVINDFETDEKQVKVSLTLVSQRFIQATMEYSQSQTMKIPC
jgi:hypothetical protein